MPFEILMHKTAADDLAKQRVHDQRKINDAIVEQLTHQPTTPTRQRKPLEGLKPAFAHLPPVWQIRVVG
jgi:mRNA-degrading endonuclease RelE of RelBE toxin-antitoxin system